MLEKTTIARPYAQAAFAQAREEGALESWTEFLRLLDAVVADTRMQKIMHHPRVTPEQLADIIFAVAGGRLSESQQNFVRLLIASERLPFAPQIRKLFDAQRAEAESIAEVEVISAYPLNEALRKKIAESMARRINKRIELKASSNQKLIGGAVIRIGDSVIDASLKGRLEELRTRLI
jgi:F-type H+-transporting ATPase subunit delta